VLLLKNKMGNNTSTPLNLCQEVIRSNNKILNINEKIITQPTVFLKENTMKDIVNDITLINNKICDSNEKIIDKLILMVPSFNKPVNKLRRCNSL